MASITIRNLDERVKQNLRKSAAAHGVSMEQEARKILSEKFAPVQKKPKMSAKEFRIWLDSIPTGEPLDQRYVTMDHKTLSDMISEGEL